TITNSAVVGAESFRCARRPGQSAAESGKVRRSRSVLQTRGRAEPGLRARASISGECAVGAGCNAGRLCMLRESREARPGKCGEALDRRVVRPRFGACAKRLCREAV